MSPPALEIRLAEISALEIEQTAGLFKTVWPGVKRLTPEYLTWLYATNPSGQMIGMNAWSGSDLVGHYAIVPIDAKDCGQSRKAALSLNTAVHPGFRGQGLFKTLAEKSYALAATLGIDHVVGVANDNSTPGFVGSLKFQLVSPLTARLFTQAPKPAPASFAWQRDWTPRSLEWRLRNPAALYTYQVHSEGLEINAPTRYWGLKSVLRFESKAENRAVIEKCLTQVQQLQPRLWFGLNAGLRFSPVTSVTVPKFLRLAALNLIFRSLNEPGRRLEPQTLNFAAIDFDVV